MNPPKLPPLTEEEIIGLLEFLVDLRKEMRTRITMSYIHSALIGGIIGHLVYLTFFK